MSSPAPSSARQTPIAPLALSDEELQRELQRLQSDNAALENQVTHGEEVHRQLVEKVVKLQQTAELEEDAIANSLLKKVDQARKEVKHFKTHIRQEEDQHSTLRKQIDEIKKEQVRVENMLEAEQELLVNKLQRELLETSRRKQEMESALADERREYLELLHQQLTELMTVSTGAPSPPHPNAQRQYSSAHSRTLSDPSVCMSMNASLCGGDDAVAQALCGVSSGVADRSLAASQNIASPAGSTVSNTSRRTPRRSIAELEEEINHLLLEHADFRRKATVQEHQYEELVGRLSTAQQLSFLDRARQVKMHEDLAKTRKELEELQAVSSNRSTPVLAQLVSHLYGQQQHRRTPSQQQCGDETPASQTATPLHLLSLRDRTKEVLSTPRIVPSATRQRGSSVTSDHRSASPSLMSGYSSGAERQVSARGLNEKKAAALQQGGGVSSSGAAAPNDGPLSASGCGFPTRSRNWSVTSNGSVVCTPVGDSSSSNCGSPQTMLSESSSPQPPSGVSEGAGMLASKPDATPST